MTLLERLEEPSEEWEGTNWDTADDPADPDGGAVAWAEVCPLDRLEPDRGVCALVGGRAVAVFRCSPDDELYALGNHDPYSGASVLSRGVVGSVGDVPAVASPVYKQRFDLRTGAALADPAVSVPVYPVRVVGDRVVVGVPRRG